MAKYAAPKVMPLADATIDAPQRFDVVRMARLLGVSTSGFFAWRKRRGTTELTARRQRRADLTVKIVEVHADSDGTYGSPRITSELRERGEVVSEKTAAKIMAEIGIDRYCSAGSTNEERRGRTGLPRRSRPISV
ncbi:IS3 family transposase [Nocardia sp. NPDC051981]|uniref:IS3 family transposase n=1 Tax=Nocardia sp. NPDC051981 TaxID=3155417 RepID=UPI003439A54E